MPTYHTIVIGAGLAGLTSAAYLAQAGRKTLLISGGIGALALASGCIDVLGYQPADSKTPLDSPLQGIPAFLKDHPDHPYHLLGAAGVRAGIDAFLQITNYELRTTSYRLNQKPETQDLKPETRNWFLPTPAGAVHPTALAPASLAAGELRAGGKMLIVGFNELRDFYPALLCDNLNAQNLGVTATALNLDAPPPAAGRWDITPLQLANIFEGAEFRRQVINALKKAAQSVDRVGFPAVLGLRRHAEVMADLERSLGKPVFEISTLPPSVPGRRLYEHLKDVFLKAGGRLLIGSKVLDGAIENGRVTHIRHQTVTRPKPLRAEHYILATGGIYGEGLEVPPPLREGQGEGEDSAAKQPYPNAGGIREPIFNLPVTAPPNRADWFGEDLFLPQGHGLRGAGIRVDERFNPLDARGAVIAKNLYVVGSMLAHVNWIQGRTGDGVAIASAFNVAKQILQMTNDE